MLIGLAGIAALTLASYISVPVYPVPMTLQTMAVLLAGALFGSWRGTLVVLAWLALVAAGLPLLSEGRAGLDVFAGSTGGYLMSFPLAAFLAGRLPKSDSMSAHAARLFGYLALHGLILMAGWAWLARMIGPVGAFESGVAPFIIGALLKSGLAGAIYALARKTD